LFFDKVLLPICYITVVVAKGLKKVRLMLQEVKGRKEEEKRRE
jgi:hypothetical protein